MGPLDRGGVVIVPCVGAVQHKGRELDGERGGAPHLDQLAVRHGKVPSVGRELHVVHLVLKVEVVQDHAPAKVDQHGAAHVVHREQQRGRGRQGDPRNVAAVLEGQRVGPVAAHEPPRHPRSFSTEPTGRQERERLPHKVKHGHPVAHGTDEAVAIRREQHVALLVHRPAEVGKLDNTAGHTPLSTDRHTTAKAQVPRS